MKNFPINWDKLPGYLDALPHKLPAPAYDLFRNIAEGFSDAATKPKALELVNKALCSIHNVDQTMQMANILGNAVCLTLRRRLQQRYKTPRNFWKKHITTEWTTDWCDRKHMPTSIRKVKTSRLQLIDLRVAFLERCSDRPAALRYPIILDIYLPCPSICGDPANKPPYTAAVQITKSYESKYPDSVHIMPTLDLLRNLYFLAGNVSDAIDSVTESLACKCLL